MAFKIIIKELLWRTFDSQKWQLEWSRVIDELNEREPSDKRSELENEERPNLAGNKQDRPPIH